jgi:hypothetical protein
MPILGILASSYAVPSGAFESIATTTVGSGGSATVTFSTIPGTYKHLQFRIFAQCNRITVGVDALKFTFNGVGGTSYAGHNLRGDGANPVIAGGSGSDALISFARVVGTGAGGSFGASVIDILDYANTDKNKTVRGIGGIDVNGTVGGIGGSIGLSSGLFNSTAAISSVTFTPDGGTLFNQHSSFALYGIRG